MAVAELASRTPRVDLPVLTQEMRVRQRGARPFLVLFVYVAVLCVVALLVVNDAVARAGARSVTMIPQTVNYAQAAYQVAPVDQMAVYGRMLYGSLALAQLMMIVLIVPAYGAGAVTTEREKGTFESLAITLLSSSSIITQKMAAAVSQALMLMLCSLPVLGVVFMLGGVSPLEVLVVYALLTAAAVMLGAVAVLCSCCFSKTRAAILAAYTATLSFFVGVPMMGGWFQAVGRIGPVESRDYYFPLAVMFMFAFTGAVLALLIYGLIALLVKWAEQLEEGRRFPRTLAGFTIIFLLLAFAWSVSYLAVALAPWLILPLMTEGVRERWRSRTCRMVVFGAVYALVLAVVINGTLSDSLINSLYRESVFLLLFVNPLFALSAFTGRGLGSILEQIGIPYVGHGYYHPRPYPGPLASVAMEAVLATAIFSIGIAYMCRQLSVGKLEAMRRV